MDHSLNITEIEHIQEEGIDGTKQERPQYWGSTQQSTLNAEHMLYYHKWT